MPQFRAPRGTRDLLPAERAAFARLEGIARELAVRYGYPEMDTPLFEESEVFERGVGAATDVVEKELFRVAATRGEEGDRWALRPEATAGIVRAYLQHGMQALPQPVRVSLCGPMFRYDRPQAGRYREFWQWDVEAIGDPGPAVDAELIELGLRFYAMSGVADVAVHLNSIGDGQCRPAYLERLRAYFEAHASALAPAEAERLKVNPLRLLDSKDPDLAALIAAAPRLVDHLCGPCADHLAAVQAHLAALGIEPHLEPTLVRGLDYYTRTAFEFYRQGATGQQQALGGGGRYDGLVELLGGKPTPGIGFALGLDRVVLALADQGQVTPTGDRTDRRGRGRRRAGHDDPPPAGDRSPRGRPGRARGPRHTQAGAPAGGRGTRWGPLRGHRGRRARSRPGAGARPAGGDAALGERRRPGPRPEPRSGRPSARLIPPRPKPPPPVPLAGPCKRSTGLRPAARHAPSWPARP